MSRVKYLGVFFLLMLIIGCSSSKFSDAEKYIKQKQYDQALREYLKKLDPHVRDGKRYIYYDKEATTGIGKIYWHMQKYQTAIKVMSTVLQKNPTFGKALFYTGMSYEGMGNDEEAVNYYRKYPIVEKNDPYRRVLSGRLDWLIRQKMVKEVQDAIKNERRLTASASPEKSVAVLYFLSLSEDTQWFPLQKGIAEMIITDLSQVEELKVVERIRLNYLMDELRMDASGLMEENMSPRLSKLMGVRTLIKGSFMITPSLHMTLDAGIYEPETIYLPTTSNLEGNLSKLFRMEKELVLRIINYFGIELTAEQRERIFEIPTENMMAFMNYCKGLEALDRSDFRSARSFFRKAIRLDPRFQMAKDKIVTPQVWAATHSDNFKRIGLEVDNYVNAMARKQPESIYVAPELVTTLNRLRWMGHQHKATIIPSKETRNSFNEAERSLFLIPQLLDEPPLPESINK